MSQTTRFSRLPFSLGILIASLSLAPSTPAQCAVVSDLVSGAGGSSPEQLTPAFGRELYFTFQDPVIGKEVWKWDATNGVTLVADVNPSFGNIGPSQFMPACFAIGPRVIFDTFVLGSGTELFITNGTPGGTTLLKEIRPGSSGSNPRNFVECDGRVFFAADNGTNGTELWVTDGTSGGTVMVADLNSGSGSSTPSDLIALDGLVIFTAWTPATGREIWSSDGTAAGTIMLGDLDGGTSWSTGSGGHVRFKDAIYFVGDDGVAGRELWKTDGSLAGTMMVSDLYAGPGSSQPFLLTPCGDLLFFTASTLTVPGELYATDGTNPSFLVADVRPGPQSSLPRNLTSSGGRLFFGATSDTTLVGEELWVSDGTPAGTTMVKDINPGGASGAPNEIVSIGSNICFYANDANGFELWFSDGTSAGTFLLCDIVPGPGSGTPQNLVTVAGQVFFKANDPALGNELFRIQTPGADAEILGMPGLPDRPTLGTQNDAAPVLGTTLDILAEGPAGHSGLLFAAAPALPLPPFAPLMLGGCDWAGILSGTGLAVVATASPSLTVPLTLPNQANLEGLTLHLQMIWVNVSANPPLQLSNGLQLVLGPDQAH